MSDVSPAVAFLHDEITRLRAALDRLIREAVAREREACAEALWDACPLDRIVNIAYVRRAQDAIRNRETGDE